MRDLRRYVPAEPGLPIPSAEIARLLGCAAAAWPELRARFEASGHRLGAGPDIALADYFRLLRWLALTNGEETFSLSRRPILFGAVELVLSRARASATIGEGLQRIAQAYNLLHGGDYNRVEWRGAQLVFSIHDDGFPYTRERDDDALHFALESALIFLLACVCELAQADISPSLRRVMTKRSSAEGAGAAGLGFWNAPVQFGCEAYGLAFDGALAARRLGQATVELAADAAVHNRILELVDGRSLSLEGPATADEVRRALRDGLPDQASVARRLGLSVATLRRRLALAGHSFRELREEVLNERAKSRLREGLLLAEISDELGFSDLRAFTRAFRRWNGRTPSAFRAARLGEPEIG
jgi:AraC-like DNA-binding protein